MSDARHIAANCGGFTNVAGQVLLVRTPRRGWELPGGQVEPGEDLITALEREVREESGCVVEVERLVALYSSVAPPEKVIFLFRGRHRTRTPCPGDETLDAAWLSEAEARERVTNPPDALRLRDALAGQERLIYQVYATRPLVEWMRDRSL